MGQAVVGGELDALQVHEDETRLGRGRAHEQADDEGVDHDALARAGRAGDEEVGHAPQVGGPGVPGHVAPEGEGELRWRFEEARLLDHAAQGHDVEVGIGDLQADHALARDGRLDAQRPCREGHREVVGQGLDPADLDVRRRLDLVLGDHRAGVAADDLGLDVEARELLDDDLLVAAVDRLLAAG